MSFSFILVKSFPLPVDMSTLIVFCLAFKSPQQLQTCEKVAVIVILDIEGKFLIACNTVLWFLDFALGLYFFVSETVFLNFLQRLALVCFLFQAARNVNFL